MFTSLHYILPEYTIIDKVYFIIPVFSPPLLKLAANPAKTVKSEPVTELVN